MRMTTLRIIPVLLALFLAHAMGGEPRIAILGDSIPYSGQWPALVEAALRQTPAYRHAEIVSMALPSETVSGLSEPGHAGGASPARAFMTAWIPFSPNTRPPSSLPAMG